FVCLCDHFICIFSFFQRYAAPRALHSFPTRRSSDLRNAASDRAREEPLMLNQADNTLLTRIEPGTPMGAMLREYWVPACRSAKRSEEHTSELQSRENLVCRLLLEKKKQTRSASSSAS